MRGALYPSRRYLRSKVLSIQDNKVRFSYKDYANGGHRREMALDATEILRRFLQHVLPKGFVRIRYYVSRAPQN